MNISNYIKNISNVLSQMANINEELVHSIKSNDIDKVIELLDKGAELNY